jgi:peptidoglycan-associated lipoprotein
MNRTVLSLTCVAALACSVALVGCAKKKPKTTAESMQPAPQMQAPAEEVTPEPTPQPMDDETRALMSEDLQVVNDYVTQRGLIGDVYFDFDEYELKPEARERLAKNADFMKSHPEFVFTIEGHCDERGTNEYNLALGDRRANAAKNYLMTLGVSGAHLKTISYGEERPVCTQSTEACWARNRRAHFLVTGRGNG